MYTIIYISFTDEKIHDEQELANGRCFYHETFQSGTSSRSVSHGGE